MAWKVDIVGGLSLDVGDVNIGAVNVLNAADTQINPATEETLQDILTALGGASTPAIAIFESGSATSVPVTTWTPIISYPVPVGKTLKLEHAHGTGNVYAKWRLNLGATKKAFRRSSDGGGLDVSWDYADDNNPGGVEVAGGQTVSIEAYHTRPWLGEFDAEITGRLL